jgi:hypothetical protein
MRCVSFPPQAAYSRILFCGVEGFIEKPNPEDHKRLAHQSYHSDRVVAYLEECNIPIVWAILANEQASQAENLFRNGFKYLGCYNNRRYDQSQLYLFVKRNKISDGRVAEIYPSRYHDAKDDKNLNEADVSLVEELPGYTRILGSEHPLICTVLGGKLLITPFNSVGVGTKRCCGASYGLGMTATKNASPYSINMGSKILEKGKGTPAGVVSKLLSKKAPDRRYVVLDGEVLFDGSERVRSIVMEDASSNIDTLIKPDVFDDFFFTTTLPDGQTHMVRINCRFPVSLHNLDYVFDTDWSV